MHFSRGCVPPGAVAVQGGRLHQAPPPSPWEQTPPPPPPEQTPPGSRPPPGADTPPGTRHPPGADTPRDQAPPREQTPTLLTESQTPVKTLPCPNFVAGSNKNNAVMENTLGKHL